MKDYVNRMIKEQQELYERYMKLHIFIGSPEFEALSLQKQHLMRMQEHSMSLYYHFLNERVALELEDKE